jgi:hypothetical protein
MIAEEWKAVVGFEGLYEVSNMGRIKSLDKVIVRSNGSPQTWKGRHVAVSYSGNRYLQVHMHHLGKQTTKGLHVIVAEAFVQNTNNKPQVNHKNRIREDCTAANLEWVTPSENICHILAQGCTMGKTKLNLKAARALREDAAAGLGTDILSKKYGISKGMVNRIKNNHAWKEEKYAEFL